MRALTLGELILLNELRRREAMAGEIRDAMASFRASREKMVAAVVAEIHAAAAEHPRVQQEAKDAVILMRGETEGFRQEIREITAEFAPESNGGPSGPLPGSDVQSGNGATPKLEPNAPARPIASL